MPVATFDTLKFARSLQEAGVSERQAEAEAVVLSEVFSINFKDSVTKDDLNHAVAIVESKLREAEQTLNARLDLLKTEMREMEQRLNGKLDAKFDSVGYELKLFKWMDGVVITLIIGIGVQLLFFR